MSLASIRRALNQVGTELSERNAVLGVLRASGHHRHPLVIQGRSPDRRVVRIYLWRDTPFGNLALVSGPDVEAAVYQLFPARPGSSVGEVFIQESRHGPALTSARSNPVARVGAEKTDPKTGEEYIEWRPVMPDGSRPRIRLSLEDELVVHPGEAEDMLASARQATAEERATKRGRERTGKAASVPRATRPRRKARAPSRAPSVAAMAPMFDSAGREYLVEYRVVTTAENGSGPVIPSNAPRTMAPVRGYPSAFQARSLAGAAETAKIREISRNLDPTRLLIANADATLGAPVVWPGEVHPGDLYVLAGNGRAIALLGAPAARYKAYQREGRKLWPHLWPKGSAAKGKRRMLVRLVSNADGSPLTEVEAVNLAGASQASTAGAESPIGSALSTVRALGLTDLSGAPPFEWGGIITVDNVEELASRNQQFVRWLLGRLDPATAESYKTDEGLTDLLNRIMVGFLPTVVQERGFASEKEERALLAAMPILVTIHQGVEDGRVKPGWDLLPLLGPAERFASVVRRLSVKQALSEIEKAARQVQLGESTPGAQTVQTLWDELPPLALMLGFALKKAGAVRDPAISIERYLTPYLEEALRDVPGQALMFGALETADTAPPDPAETLARILKIPLPERTRVRNPGRLRLAGMEGAIEAAYQAIEDRVGFSLEFPPIRAMTPQEIEEGRRVRGPGHEGGAGHGQYDPVENEVAINASMTPQEIFANIVHENAHFAFPELHEVEVDSLTEEILSEILPQRANPTPSFLPDQATAELAVLARDGSRTYAEPYSEGLLYLRTRGMVEPVTCTEAGETLYGRDTCTWALSRKGLRTYTKLRTQAQADAERAQTRLWNPSRAPKPKTKVQTLLFSRRDFGKADARAWARDHGYTARKVHATAAYYRVRQAPPDQFRKGTFRTIELVAGVKAVVGVPKGR